MDYSEDVTSYFEDGIDGLVSVHNMLSIWKPFTYERINNQKNTIYPIRLAYNTFGRSLLEKICAN